MGKICRAGVRNGFFEVLCFYLALASVFILIVFYSPRPADAFCFEEAARMYAEYGVSPDLLRAIATVESSMTPDALNCGNSNGSCDYGLMQINSLWGKYVEEELWNGMADPCMNVKLGAWILARNFHQRGATWESVGYYNSSQESSRKRYARKVHRAYQERTATVRQAQTSTD